MTYIIFILSFEVNVSHKLLLCENCENVVSITNTTSKIFICPACGAINKKDRTANYIGHLVIESTEVNCNLDDEDGIIKIEDGNEELSAALYTLTKFGWSMKFKGIKVSD